MEGPVITLFPLVLDLADAIVTACGVYVAWMLMTGQTRFLALREQARRAVEVRHFLARARRPRPAPARLLTYSPTTFPGAPSPAPSQRLAEPATGAQAGARPISVA